MPKERYRLYHAEKAKGGMALTMTAGSAIVSRDSPAAFGNLHAYRDEIVPWLGELADACHEHDCKVMIQLTHLGRRTGWNKADWLPVLSASPVREPAHRSFPKQAEDWDLDRIVADYASAAARMQAAGLDGIEFEAYGHLLDGFLVARHQPARRRIWRLARQPPALHLAGDRRGARRRRSRFHRRHPHGRRRGFRQGPVEGRGRRDRATAGGVPKIRFPQHHPRLDRDRRCADQGDPDHRHALVAASRFRRRGEGGDQVPGLPCRAHLRCRDRQACDRHRQARHGRHDARPPRRPAYREEGDGRPRAPDPPLCRRDLLPRPHL